SHNGSDAKLGIMINDTVVDVERLGHKTQNTFPVTMLDLIDAGNDEVARITGILEASDENIIASVALPKAECKILAPIPRPRKNIIGIGLNYTENVAEIARTLDTSKDLPQHPVIFSKPPTTVVGTGEYILHNTQLTQQLDWEV